MESSNEHNQQLFVIHLIFTGAAIVCPSVCLFVHQSVFLSTCLSVHMNVCPYIVCLSIRLYVCSSVCLSLHRLCLFVRLFVRLFVPPSEWETWSSTWSAGVYHVTGQHFWHETNQTKGKGHLIYTNYFPLFPQHKTCPGTYTSYPERR